MAVTMTSTRSVQEEADEILHAVMATPEGHADPYPYYHRLRRLAPVHHCALDGVWYVTDFETCRQLLGDSRVGKNDQIVVRRHGVDEARVKLAERRGRPTMLTTNPPDHSRLRGVAKGAFIPPSRRSSTSAATRARLARMEGQLVFAGLRERFGRLELVGEPVRRPGLVIRALDSLPVRFTPR